MPHSAPSCSSTALVAIVVPWNRWSIVPASSSACRHSSRTPWITPRDGSSEVVGTLWISVRPAAVSHSTRSVNVPPTSTPISLNCASAYCLILVRKPCASRPPPPTLPRKGGGGQIVPLARPDSFPLCGGRL